MVNLGFTENLNGTLYMAQSLIGPGGEVLMHRHKTKPTHVERVLFGDGTGKYNIFLADYIHSITDYNSRGLYSKRCLYTSW